jgi:hypothetical protein
MKEPRKSKADGEPDYLIKGILSLLSTIVFGISTAGLSWCALTDKKDWQAATFFLLLLWFSIWGALKIEEYFRCRQ